VLTYQRNQQVRVSISNGPWSLPHSFDLPSPCNAPQKKPEPKPEPEPEPEPASEHQVDIMHDPELSETKVPLSSLPEAEPSVREAEAAPISMRDESPGEFHPLEARFAMHF